MRRRLLVPLLSMLLALALGTAYAESDPPAPVLNRTLTCTASSAGRFACFVEQTILSAGPWELAVGLDALARPWEPDPFQVGGYALIGYYGDTLGVWVELHVPRLAPVIGSPDVLRAGFRIRF